MASHDYRDGNLHVVFVNGRAYRYANVPEELADQFRDADSLGKFLHANIIGRFDAYRIGTGDDVDAKGSDD